MEFLDRARLAQKVFNVVCDNTDVLENWGEGLAYLMGAILNDASFVADTNDEKEFVKFLKKYFGNNDELWDFVNQ